MEAALIPIKGNQQGLTNYSKSFEPIKNLSKDENELLAIKYKSAPLGSLPDVNLILTVKQLILRIYVITGWTVPAGEIKNILEQQFIKKIKESYSTLNEEEIEYAFRCSFVKDWGKDMNLALIDTVLNNYLEKRADVSRMEERYRVELPESKEPPMPDDEFIELNKNIYIKSKLFGYVHPKCYDILIKQGKITRPEGEERERIMKTARHNFFSIENKDYTNVLSHEEIERFINQDCKKICVAEYFNNEMKK